MESARGDVRGPREPRISDAGGTRDKFSSSALRVLITDAHELLKEHDRLNPGRVDPPWIRLLRDLSAVVEHLLTERDEMRARKDAAYEERNRVVAALSKFWPSHLARHPEADASWERDWMTIVCIHSPRGQLTWHVHDSQRPLFTHLAEGDNHWDGHDTPEKYRRLNTLGLLTTEPR